MRCALQRALARPPLTRLCSRGLCRVSSSALAAAAAPATPAAALARSAQLRRRAAPTRAISGGSGGSTMKYRDPIVIRPAGQHSATVIMLHGLGDSGEGWAPVRWSHHTSYQITSDQIRPQLLCSSAAPCASASCNSHTCSCCLIRVRKLVCLSTFNVRLCQLFCANSFLPTLLCQLFCAKSFVPSLLCQPKHHTLRSATSLPPSCRTSSLCSLTHRWWVPRRSSMLAHSSPCRRRLQWLIAVVPSDLTPENSNRGLSTADNNHQLAHIHHCHVRQRAISINMGMSMPGWFDISSLEEIDGAEDGPGIIESKR